MASLPIVLVASSILAGGMFEVALRFGGPGADPARPGRAVGLKPLSGQCLVEGHCRPPGLTSGNPHIARRGERPVPGRIARLAKVGGLFECCGSLCKFAGLGGLDRTAGLRFLGSGRSGRLRRGLLGRLGRRQ